MARYIYTDRESEPAIRRVWAIYSNWQDFGPWKRFDNVERGDRQYLDRDHVPFDLADLALARLYALGEFLQLRADLAEGDGGLQLAVTPLQLVQLGTQVHTHNADLFLQTAHTHIPSRESRWLARENKSTLSSTLTH